LFDISENAFMKIQSLVEDDSSSFKTLMHDDNNTQYFGKI